MDVDMDKKKTKASKRSSDGGGSGGGKRRSSKDGGSTSGRRSPTGDKKKKKKQNHSQTSTNPPPPSGVEAFQVAYDASLSPANSDRSDNIEVGTVPEGSALPQLKPTEGGLENEKLKETNDEQKWLFCFKTRWGCYTTLFILVLAVAVAVAVPLFLTGNKDNSENLGIALLSDFSEGEVVSEFPVEICNDWIPGQGKSEVCTSDQTALHGGDVCNILAHALLNSTTDAEIAIVNAGVCTSDIRPTQLRRADIEDAISAEELYIVAMSGADVITLLEQAFEQTFGETTNDASAYPYASGLRFGVDAHFDYRNRVTEVEAVSDLTNDFREISLRRFYSVITTKELAEGQHGYSQFAAVIDSWKTPLPYQTVDAFFNYALTDANWWEPNTAEYSTQRFVTPDTEPVLGWVPNDICLGWTPDTKSSVSLCSQGTAVVGGGVCNLVAWALLDQNLQADMAILNGAVCGSEVPSGNFVLSRANAMIPGNPDLVTVELSGEKIVTLLEDAINAFVEAPSADERYDAYPFCAALRFDVNALEEKGGRLSDVEFFTSSNRWVPLDQNSQFTLLTTSDIARGNDPVYGSFFQEAASPNSIRDLPRGSVDTLLRYASDWEVLYEPPTEKHSTQSFIG